MNRLSMTAPAPALTHSRSGSMAPSAWFGAKTRFMCAASARRSRSLPRMLSYPAVVSGCAERIASARRRCTVSTVEGATARLTYPSSRVPGSRLHSAEEGVQVRERGFRRVRAARGKAVRLRERRHLRGVVRALRRGLQLGHRACRARGRVRRR